MKEIQVLNLSTINLHALAHKPKLCFFLKYLESLMKGKNTLHKYEDLETLHDTYTSTTSTSIGSNYRLQTF